jgi:microcystin-dependent protein
LASIGKAVELSYAINVRDRSVKIKLADGRYTESVLFSNSTTGSGIHNLIDIVIIGNEQDPSKVIWKAAGNASNQRCVIVQRNASIYLSGITFTAEANYTGAQEFIRAQYSSQVTIGKVVFGSASASAMRVCHLCCVDSLVRVMTEYTIAGNATNHIDLSSNSTFFIGAESSSDIPVRLVGTPIFDSFIVLSNASVAYASTPNFTYSGEARGKKFTRDATSVEPSRFPNGLTEGTVSDVFLAKAYAETPTFSDRTTRVATTAWVRDLVPDKLISGRTYYVSQTGSNSNSGLSAQSPLATISKALDLAYSLNVNRQSIVIQLLDGTYKEAVYVANALRGMGRERQVDVIIQGNINNPAAVVWLGTDGIKLDKDRLQYCLLVDRGASVLVRGINFVASDSDYNGDQHLISADRGSTISIGNVIFSYMSGGIGNRFHIFCTSGAVVQVVGSYKISSGAQNHIRLGTGGLFTAYNISSTPYVVTLETEPTFNYFIEAYDAGVAYASRTALTFQGTARGKKFARAASAEMLVETFPTGLEEGINLETRMGAVYAYSPEHFENSTRVPTTKWVRERINQEIASSSYSNNLRLVPPGTLLPFAAAFAPDGFLLCEGQAVSRTTYSNLFEVLKTGYGAGDGSTTFNLPDLRGTTIIGAGQKPGLTKRTVTETGGSESVTLTSQQLPSHSHGVTIGDHTHGVTDPRHSHTINDPGHVHSVHTDYAGPDEGASQIDHARSASGEPKDWNTSATATGVTVNSSATGISIQAGGSTTVTSAPTGGAEAHSNMQPWIALSYIIKY